MKTDDIRKSYLDFFASKKHVLVSSDSLVPQNDPSLLFTGAGMNQFKEYFLGLKKDMSRATSSQKCLRTADLDEVGKTAYHHSFFEMLGNFSFGDYFKREAIQWAWEYLTQVLKIPPVRLRVTVHQSDDEAYNIWKNEIGLPSDRIYRMGDKSNFWPSNAPKDGPNGPCGPCSEIYFDSSDHPEAPADTVESKRFAEIWNLVFTQFDRRDGGELTPLANKNIDTGMGLERLACVLQGKQSNFEIDIFQPIHSSVKLQLGLENSDPDKRHLYAISDHIRAVVFCIHDGAVPGNEGRGYVVRKIIRRALWHAHQIVPGGELREPFLYKLVGSVVAVMKTAYPELIDAEKSISSTIRSEEERFLTTLETGLRILGGRLSELRAAAKTVVPGEIIFELYDTYGFPEELTRAIAEAQQFTLDQAGFEREMARQRQRAKEASRISASIFTSNEIEEKVLRLPESRFLGYETLSSDARVLLAEIKDGKGVIVLDQTPFYGESGGQVGDKGVLEADGFLASVVDTLKKDNRIMHMVEIEKGTVPEKVTARVDKRERDKTMRNHTATHLLHAALRHVLGTHVRQFGSLVSPEKLRFDYAHTEALSAEQIRKIEDEVNREILSDEVVTKIEKPIEEARKEGAIAFFGEKYGEKVRIVTAGSYSKEFCGGTHCDRTGQIGLFVITSDSSISSGTRRIEALTGEGAVAYLRTLRAQLDEVSSLLKTSPAALKDRVIKIQEKMKMLEKKQKQGGLKGAESGALPLTKKPAGGYEFVSLLADGSDANELRTVSDNLRSKAAKTVYFLAAKNEEKIQYLLGMSPDLAKTDLDLKQLFDRLAPMLKGSGGGRKDLIQGGARNEGQLESAWNQIIDSAVTYLAERKS